MFKRAVFIGFGLIGSSLARVMRAQQLAHTIVACTRSQSTLDAAIALGIVDEVTVDPTKAVQGADLVVLAVPVALMEPLLRQIAPHLHPNAIITDVGSTKGNVATAALNVFGNNIPTGLVPAHPIAGAENSGVHAGRADLFVNHKVIVTPLPSSSEQATEQVIRLWESAGANVITMGVAEHDHVLAQTSHLPHLLAFALVDQLSHSSTNLDVFKYAAGGLRDFTRIAASDPQMWHDIFLQNKAALNSAINSFELSFAQIKHSIDHNDSTALLNCLHHAARARRHFGAMLNQGTYMQSKSNQQTFTLQPQGSVNGDFSVPGDKSVSHRSIMFGALADGVTTVSNFLEGEDALATLQAFVDMGVRIDGPSKGKVTIYGVGVDGLQAPKQPLYMGNSGTSMRLLSGILSAQPFDSIMTGDASLSKRPMERVAKPLRSMGALIQSTGDKGTPPLSITGAQQLNAISYTLPMASAQVKSGLLLAGIWAKGITSVTEPEPTRDHTERMLQAFGYPVQVDGATVSIKGGGRLTATHIDVPADISSAAFFMVAAAIARNSRVVLRKIGINPTRTGVIEILKQMGANISLSNQSIVGGEPVADITITSSVLKGIHIPEDQVPLAIDEFPALFIAASCASGTTTLTGAAELRVKESDRIKVMADGLQLLGISCQPTADGMVIEGKGDIDAVFGGGQIASQHDHRIAMSFAIASLRASAPIVIEGCETVATSFPNFVSLAKSAGMGISSTEQ